MLSQNIYQYRLHLQIGYVDLEAKKCNFHISFEEYWWVSQRVIFLLLFYTERPLQSLEFPREYIHHLMS